MAKKKTTAAAKNLNETGNRKSADRRKNQSVEPPKVERRKNKRRRQIDPTTCEREYNEDEIAFMHALDEYKNASGRMFPTCSEILEVFMGLGYRKVAAASEGFAFQQSNEDVDFDSESEFDEETLESELEDQII